MGGKVIEVESKAQWDEIIALAKKDGKVVLIDFSATWCGPCKMISPVFEDMSTKYENVIFLKVDVDAVDEVATMCSISAMPTFQVFINGEKKDELVGAAKDKLINLCEKYKT
ncbi:hypothetical protein BSKO_02153 [Bryopsis sp. KO-2023]|nr:hypothetical protein BSKO_02153 [Bryopsis sp. KO-2023]